jgi:hypothetical protein
MTGSQYSHESEGRVWFALLVLNQFHQYASAITVPTQSRILRKAMVFMVAHIPKRAELINTSAKPVLSKPVTLLLDCIGFLAGFQGSL